MSKKEIKNYSEFWDFYVAEHSEPLTRLLHFVGTSLGLVLLVWVCGREIIFIFRCVLSSFMLLRGFRILQSRKINPPLLNILFGLLFPITK